MTLGEFWRRWRVRLGYPVCVACWLVADPRPLSLTCGGGVALIGLLIRGAAAGHLRKGEVLATSGPYAWTRNPLYFGSALLAAGLAIACATWASAALVTAYFLGSYPAVMGREEEELRRLYGSSFDEYAARVPLFWPRAPRRGAPGEEFSWERYRRNREYQSALGFAAALALLAMRRLWRP